MDRRAPTLVVGYDGSDAARVAVKHAVAVASPDGKVVAVSAFGPAPDWLQGDEYERVVADHRTSAQATLDELAARAPECFGQVSHELTLAEAAPVEAILAAAQEHGADGIVVGSRGFGFVSGGLGSVSHELLQRSDRPVTVIPRACVQARAGAT